MVDNGYDATSFLTLFEAWFVSLAYTFQIYFDFSGYSDMAIGVALLFNIRFPANFNSPYNALSIQDFWRRWHITLSRFLRSYIYFPLGGSNGTCLSTYRNIMITFIIGGIWHGAGWGFIIWGLLHATALIIQRIWMTLNIKMNKFLAWFLTFNFINFTWIFFKSRDMFDALKVLKGMVGLSGVSLPINLKSELLANYGIHFFNNLDYDPIIIIIICFCFYTITFNKNFIQIIDNFKPNWKYGVLISMILFISIRHLNKKIEFVYFQF